jgi:hypothetical protein
MITKDTIPYTDKKGYRHIGGFPYGANLSLIKMEQLYLIMKMVFKQYLPLILAFIFLEDRGQPGRTKH